VFERILEDLSLDSSAPEAGAAEALAAAMRERVWGTASLDEDAIANGEGVSKNSENTWEKAQCPDQR
jgi:uncharacterized membrane protein